MCDYITNYIIIIYIVRYVHGGVENVFRIINDEGYIYDDKK